MQLQYIDNLWAFNNPIVIIQRALRHFMPPVSNSSSIPSSRHTPMLASKQIDRRLTNQSRGPQGKASKQVHPLKEYFE